MQKNIVRYLYDSCASDVYPHSKDGYQLLKIVYVFEFINLGSIS